MRFIDSLLFCGLIFFSCEAPQSKECKQETAEDQETEQIARVNGDNLIETKGQPKKFIQDKKENHVMIVKKYGEQWDFCTCVVANDSINTASQKNLDEKQFEALMKRWETIETKCREFMTTPNTTPDERILHEKKVRKCLKENS